MKQKLALTISLAVSFGWQFWGSAVAQDAAVLQVPRIECTVYNAVNTIRSTERVPILCVGNGSYVDIGIVVKGMGNLLDQPNLNSINPINSPLPRSYYLLTVTKLADGVTMPIRIYNETHGMRFNNLTAMLSLEIPEDGATRLNKVKVWWARLKEHASNTDKTKLSNTIVSDEDVIQTYTQELIENQMGRYKLVCTYVSSGSGKWNGECTSTPILLDVVKKGTIIDN